MKRFAALWVVGFILIPANALARGILPTPLPTPVVSPGDYQSRTYSTTFSTGDVPHLRAASAPQLTYTIRQGGEVFFTATGLGARESFKRKLRPGNYIAEVTVTSTFAPQVSAQDLTGWLEDQPSRSWDCGTATTSNELLNNIDPDLRHQAFLSSGFLRCFDPEGTGRVYSGSFTDYFWWDNDYHPEESDDIRLNLTSVADWSETQYMAFSVTAVNAPTVSRREYKKTRFGMTRAQVEEVFGNTTPVFYRKVKKGKLFIYDDHVLITYSANKVTNKRWTF